MRLTFATFGEEPAPAIDWLGPPRHQAPRPLPIRCLPIRDGFGNAGAEVTPPPPPPSRLSLFWLLREGPGLDPGLAVPTSLEGNRPLRLGLSPAYVSDPQGQRGGHSDVRHQIWGRRPQDNRGALRRPQILWARQLVIAARSSFSRRDLPKSLKSLKGTGEDLPRTSLRREPSEKGGGTGSGQEPNPDRLLGCLKRASNSQATKGAPLGALNFMGKAACHRQPGPASTASVCRSL